MYIYIHHISQTEQIVSVEQTHPKNERQQSKTSPRVSGEV